MRTFLLISAVLLSVGFGLAVAGPVSAQEANDTINDSDVPELDGDSGNVVAELDDHTRIVDYRFGDGTVSMEIKADRRTTIGVVDAMAGIGEDGATTISETTHTVRPGTETVTVSASSFAGGQAVGVSARGDTVRLSTAADGEASDNPLAYFGGESGLFTGILFSLLASLGAAGWVVWQEESGVMKA